MFLFSITAHPHAYFDNSNSVSEAKRSRMHLAAAEQQHKLRQQQLFQQQMQLSLGHHYQHQQSYYRPDLRISSFQQITPPESLAFWQQQQQLTSSVCRSAYCSGVTGTPATAGAPYPPTGACCPTPRLCCYAMPYPTPAMVTDPSCLCCAQGKNQQVNVNKENLGIMRSL